MDDVFSIDSKRWASIFFTYIGQCLPVSLFLKSAMAKDQATTTKLGWNTPVFIDIASMTSSKNKETTNKGGP